MVRNERIFYLDDLNEHKIGHQSANEFNRVLIIQKEYKKHWKSDGVILLKDWLGVDSWNWRFIIISFI